MSAMTSLLRAAGLLGACFVALAATPEARSQARAQILELDRIVAIVNDDVIVESELSARVETVRAQMRDSSTQPPPEGVLRRQVLDRLIIDRLQLQLAERGGLRVDDETLNQSVAAIAAQNQLSLREFRDILERDGYDFGKFREEVRNELLISQLRLRQVDNRIRVSPQDIDNFLATLTRQGGQASSYHLGHILIAVPEAASPEQIAAVRVQAEEALARLRDGADFAQTATALSDGQQALAGGDLGWRTAAELPTIFADAIPGLAVGEMTDLIRRRGAGHGHPDPRAAHPHQTRRARQSRGGPAPARSAARAARERRELRRARARPFPGLGHRVQGRRPRLGQPGRPDPGIRARHEFPAAG
jgi:peptidyl-prolyl cis-trans isomerase SurA